MAAVQSQILNNASILSLRCYVTVVETHSFSSAARQLRIAPSTVTKQVQLIESALKVALVHRTTRRVSVTEAGERFYEQCLAILSQIDSATAVMVSENLSGHLRVTAPPSFTAATLGPHLHEFMKTYPAISLDLNVSSGTPDLIRNRIDIALVLQDQPQSKLTHFRLATCPLTLCASPAYIARRGMPARAEDLMNHECLAGRYSDLAEGWSLGQKDVWRLVNPRFKLLSDNGDLLRLACLGGVGIGSFYDFHVHDDLRSGRLVPLLTDYELQPRSIFAIVPHRTIVRPQVKAFIDFVRSRLSAPEFVL